TPLQMAMVYAAIANGGTVYKPQVVKAVVGADGQIIERREPEILSKVDVPASTMNFLQDSLQAVTRDGSGKYAFEGFPLDQIPVASKTGSAQVSGGKVSTSWFAAYAPANRPRYAVVIMVTQGGTGGRTSGPSVRAIFDALFGVSGGTVNPQDSVLIGGQPMRRLPEVRPDGTPVAPTGRWSGVDGGTVTAEPADASAVEEPAA
ncbi:MAG: penicillin-binding transpeptidase domain-containing protein, partial [Actinomycetales bacterium]